MDGPLEDLRRFALAAGTPVPSRVRLHQRGTFRLSPQGPWTPFTAEQEIATRTPAFTWRARVGASPLRRVHVEDGYAGGRGRLRAKLWGLVPVQSAKGEDVDRGELQRYLSELPWCPHAWIANPHLRFASPTEGILEVRVDGASGAAAVAFEVDADGRPGVVRARRPCREGREVAERRWRGSFADWQRFGDVVVPTRGEAAWLLPDGPFLYFRGEIRTWEAIA